MYIWTVVESILYFISKIQTTLYCLYTLLLTVGQVVVLVLIKIFHLLNNIISISSDVSNVLKEDFEIFKHDLLVLLNPSLNWIKDSLSDVFLCTQQVYHFLLWLCDGFNSCIRGVLNIFQCLKWGVEKMLVLIIDSLCLIGSTFIYCINSATDFCSIETLSQLGVIFYSHFINLIRLEAVFGLFIMIFLSIIIIKSKTHLKLVKAINFFFRKFAISSHHGIQLLLMVIPLLMVTISRHWKSIKYNLYKYVRKKEELSKLSRDDLQKLLEQEKAEKLCIICMDRKRNIILLNCQHLILCNMCVSTILQDSALCPVCRRDIFDVITVYT